MNAFSFFWNYLRWHFTTAYVDMFFIAKNYLWGIGHIFSVSTLLRTLFVPWRRLSSHSAHFFQQPFEYLGDLLVNMSMRLLGFFVRTIVLVIASFAAILVMSIALLIFVFWALLPLMLASLLIQAFSLLFI